MANTVGGRFPISLCKIGNTDDKSAGAYSSWKGANIAITGTSAADKAFLYGPVILRSHLPSSLTDHSGTGPCFTMPLPSGDYEPLLQSPPKEDKHNEKVGNRVRSQSGLALRACLFLLCCSLASLVPATLNLYLWRLRDFHNAYSATSTPEARGNVYVGLSNVRWERVLCRKRPFTYPTAYGVFSGGDIRGRSAVHAHFDEAQFGFGGPRSAHVTFYIPDIGLENCTMIFRSVLPTPSDGPGAHDPRGSALRAGFFDSTTTLRATPGTTLDVYLLSAPETLAQRTLVAQLPLDDLGKDARVVTPPFWCPSQTHVSLQIECPGDCQITFGLQGMTTATSLYTLANKTGFVIEQHEHVSCIPAGG